MTRESGFVDRDQDRTVLPSLTANACTARESAPIPESPDLQEYAEYYHLSEQLVAAATKKELV
jgi:hypothetical protein